MTRRTLKLAVLGPRGFVLRHIDYMPVWVSPSVDRLVRPAALQLAFREHQERAIDSRLPIFSSWFDLPLIGKHVKGSRLRVGFRTQHEYEETLVGLESEMPRRRGGRVPRGNRRRR